MRGLVFIFAVGLGASLAATAGASSWELSSLGGQVVPEHISASSLGLSGNIEGLATDRRGRLFVLSDRLAVFDGAGWTSVPIPGGTVVRSVAADEAGRIWIGAIDELGFCEEDAAGRLVFRSLREHLAPDDSALQDVWRCAVLGRHVFFVSRDRVLRWDGQSFRAWSFPTAARLVPVSAGDECWFTHRETGLYRLTESGPVLQARADRLPARPFFWLERQGDKWFGASRDGIFQVGESVPISEPAVADCLERNFVLEGLRLPSGELALATFGGVAIVSPDLRRLVRVLATEDGLPGAELRGMLLDETGNLWIALHKQGLVRLGAAPAASIYRTARQTTPADAIRRLVQDDDDVVAAGDAGLFTIALEAPPSFLHPLPGSPTRTRALLPMREGLLVGALTGLALYDRGSGTTTALAKSTTEFFSLLRSPSPAGEVIVLEGFRLSVLARTESGFDLRRVHDLPRPAESLMLDPGGAVWIDSPQNVAFRFNPQDGKLDAVPVPASVQSEARGIKFARTSERGFVFCGNAVFAVDGSSPRLQRWPGLPASAGIVRAVASSQRRRLFALVERAGHAGTITFGLCGLDLSRPDAAWEEYYVPELDRVGALHALIEDTRHHHLWIGTDSGVLRLNPAVLRRAPALAPPRLQVRGLPASGELPHLRHRLVAQAESPDFGRRRELVYQYRLRHPGEEPPWSAPAARGAFEFQNLSDGDHVLEVRALDRQGQVTAPASVRFRVLPPPWRSVPALVAYGGLLALGLFGIVRLREVAIRRRNAELERTVAERTAQLRQANAAKDEFLASISHEIRNPLNGVVGLAASIDDAALDPPTARKFNHLRHCATHLASLLEDILDFASIERGAFTLNPRPFEVAPLVHSIAAIAADQSAKVGRRVDIRIAPRVPPVLIGDAARLRQLLLNLVINALKYGERGEVEVTVWSKPQTPEACLVTFAVSDEGPGMPPEEIARLFQQFTRGSAAKRSRESGSGVGLSICRAIAGKMGGRLWAESVVGQGSTFSFEVPLPIASAPLAGPGPTAAPEWKVLLVDDEDYNRVALASLLESLGLRLTVARDGPEALAAHEPGRFDLALLDYDMPGMTGPELARALRKRGDAALILATTAYATPEKHAECLRAGMNAVITKPITVEKLRAAFAQAFSPQRSSPPVQLAADQRASPVAALRELATRKGSSLAEERAAFLAALTATGTELSAAIAQRRAPDSSHHAHRLLGQLAYLGHASAETLVRRLEAAVASEQWTEADQLWSESLAALESLRRELADPA